MEQKFNSLVTPGLLDVYSPSLALGWLIQSTRCDLRDTTVLASTHADAVPSPAHQTIYQTLP